MTVFIAALLAATSALAHHGNSAFDPDRVVVLTGTVTQWKWTNPHVWIFLSVDDGKGGKTEWEIEGRSPASWPVPAGRRPSSRSATGSPWISARRGTAATAGSPRASRSPMAPCSQRNKITIYGELNDVYRRIYLDGRKPSQRTLGDPTFAGYSVGHWEGDTLVVDTVALREDTLLDLFSPHSDQLTVRERIRLTSPGILEDRITATDPKALLEPFTQIRTYRKASPPNDELREFSCAEGLSSVK